MAIQATVETMHGEQRELYIRINNVEANNHGAESYALIRGFISEEAFKAGKHFVWEASVKCNLDVELPLWPQAYAQVKELLQDPADSLDAKLSAPAVDLL